MQFFFNLFTNDATINILCIDEALKAYNMKIVEKLQRKSAFENEKANK